MLVLFSDFGLDGPYVGQMKAVLATAAPSVPVIDLMHDVPPFDVKGAAYLLSAYQGAFPGRSVFVCVVDPGVGGDRLALAVKVGPRWYVGPDNGLFEIVLRRALEAGEDCTAFEVIWRPEALSASFHGRDLFAPVAANLAAGVWGAGDGGVFRPLDLNRIRRLDWPDDLSRVVYIDRFGNALTGIRAARLGPKDTLGFRGQVLSRARTFGDMPAHVPFWYENANGLVEIAVNQGDLSRALGGDVTSQDSVTFL